jgi:hypothetical protein
MTTVPTPALDTSLDANAQPSAAEGPRSELMDLNLALYAGARSLQRLAQAGGGREFRDLAERYKQVADAAVRDFAGR